jgi:uncharacterized membrane protein
MLRKSSIAATPKIDRLSNYTTWLPALTLVSLVTIFVALRIWHVTAYSLWGGEAFTMIGSRQTWNGMFSYIIADIVHPPLIYILLKLWIGLGGESVLWLKLLPDFFGIAMVVPFFLLCRELDLKTPETFLALLLMGVNGYLIHYAQELRMYSMLAFWSLCSFWLFVRYFKSAGPGDRELLVLTVVNLLAIYSHYYGWLVVGMELLFLLIWRRNVWAFGLSLVFLVLSFSPWAYFVIREARSIGGLERNLGWIPRPDLTDLLNFYSTLIGPLGSRYMKLLGLVLFNLPLLPWIWRTIRGGFKPENEDAVSLSWLSILAFLPVTLIYLISQKYDQALWIDRYFIFIASPYLLLVSVAINRWPNKALRNVWILLIALWAVAAGVIDLRTNRMAWSGPQLGSRVHWDFIAQQISAAETGQQGPIKIYTVPVFSKGQLTGDWAISTSLDYYFDSINDERFEMIYANNMQAVVDRAEDDHFWIGYFDITDWRVRSVVTMLNDNGYSVGKAITYKQLNNQIILIPVWRRSASGLRIGNHELY